MGYTIVEWPESQILMLEPGFEKHAQLITNENLSTLSQSYLIDEVWYNDKLCVQNPIKDSRIVYDKTFAIRLKSFLEKTEVNDLPSEEEKEYLLKIANKLIKYQLSTAYDPEEISYLTRCIGGN